MQQAQVNLFADMGAQPATLRRACSPATASTDTTGPTVAIDSPGQGGQPGQRQAGHGRRHRDRRGMAGSPAWRSPPTAATAGTPRPARPPGPTPTSSTAAARRPIRVRAIDDSANIGATSDPDLTVACPCSVFGVHRPATPATNDADAVELGHPLHPDRDGFVTGVRFYKGAGNDGDARRLAVEQRRDPARHGDVHRRDRDRLADRDLLLAGRGHRPARPTSSPTRRPTAATRCSREAFAVAGVDDAPLTVAGRVRRHAGRRLRRPGSFPNQLPAARNYFVDVLFTTTDTSPLTVTDQWPLAGATSVPADTEVSARLSKPVTADSGAITRQGRQRRAAVAGATTYDATTRTHLHPGRSPGRLVTYTATVAGDRRAGQPVATGGPGRSPRRARQRTRGLPVLAVRRRAPADAARGRRHRAGDPRRAVRLRRPRHRHRHPVLQGPEQHRHPHRHAVVGSRHRSSPTGHLHRRVHQRLADAHLRARRSRSPPARSTSPPTAPRSAGTPRRRTPSRRDLSRAPLLVTSHLRCLHLRQRASRATARHQLPGRRRLREGRADDLRSAAGPARRAPLDVARAHPVPVWFSAPISVRCDPDARQIGHAPVAGTTTLAPTAPSSPSRRRPAARPTPTSTVQLTGVTSDGRAPSLPTQTWTFRTAGPTPATAQTLFGDHVPAGRPPRPTARRSSSARRSRPPRDGTVTAIRFYKGAGNGGTHTGSLWSSPGTRLATVTFTGETATGWQTARAVAAGRGHGRARLRRLLPRTAGPLLRRPRVLQRRPCTSGDLTAPAATTAATSTAAGGFPTNAWVDELLRRRRLRARRRQRSPSPAGARPRGHRRVARGRPSITLSAAIATGCDDDAAGRGRRRARLGRLSADATTLTSPRRTRCPPTPTSR